MFIIIIIIHCFHIDGWIDEGGECVWGKVCGVQCGAVGSEHVDKKLSSLPHGAPLFLRNEKS